jgi:DNA-binding transcriptional LysR family regulator
MRACLKRGIGFTICPEVSVEKELKEKSLVRLHSRDATNEVSLIMIWHSEKWCSPLLRHFMRLSEEIMFESTKRS